MGVALQEIERAVALAGRVVSADGSGAALDDFVDGVLAQVAAHTRDGDFDRGADTVDESLAELERRPERQRTALERSRRALLEAGKSRVGPTLAQRGRPAPVPSRSPGQALTSSRLCASD